MKESSGIYIHIIYIYIYILAYITYRVIYITDSIHRTLKRFFSPQKKKKKWCFEERQRQGGELHAKGRLTSTSPSSFLRLVLTSITLSSLFSFLHFFSFQLPPPRPAPSTPPRPRCFPPLSFSQLGRGGERLTPTIIVIGVYVSLLHLRRTTLIYIYIYFFFLFLLFVYLFVFFFFLIKDK